MGIDEASRDRAAIAATLARARRPFGSPTAAEVTAAVGRLPEGARRLAAAPGVHVGPIDGPHVDEALSRAIAARSGRRLPSVANLRRDGSVVVAIGNVEDLGHEMIHVAQAHAGAPAMAAAFARVADDGDRLAAAIAGVTDADAGNAHRDLAWVVKAVAGDASRGSSGSHGDRHAATFDMHLTLHPTEATAAVAAGIGLDRQAAMAALFAHALRRAGSLDPSSGVSREVVAYRFQRDPEALSGLFADALGPAGRAVATARDPIDPVAAAAWVDAAVGPGSVEGADGAIGLRVAKAELGRALMGAPRDEGARAVAALLHAVRQPWEGDLVPGRHGGNVLHDSFGEGATATLWFGRDALAHHLAQAGEPARAAFARLAGAGVGMAAGRGPGAATRPGGRADPRLTALPGDGEGRRALRVSRSELADAASGEPRTPTGRVLAALAPVASWREEDAGTSRRVEGEGALRALSAGFGRGVTRRLWVPEGTLAAALAGRGGTDAAALATSSARREAAASAAVDATRARWSKKSSAKSPAKSR